MPRIILAFIALAILSMAGLAAFQAGLAEAGRDEVVTNETWTPDAGTITDLENSNRNGVYYSDNATVYNSTDARMDYGDDYIWYSANGTIKTITGGDLDGEPNATISYEYQVTTKAQRDLTSMVGQIPRLAGLALPVGVLFFFLFLIRGGS